MAPVYPPVFPGLIYLYFLTETESLRGAWTRWGEASLSDNIYIHSALYFHPMRNYFGLNLLSEGRNRVRMPKPV